MSSASVQEKNMAIWFNKTFFYINNVHFIINTARVKYLIIVFYNHEALTLDCSMALLDFIKGTNGNSF